MERCIPLGYEVCVYALGGGNSRSNHSFREIAQNANYLNHGMEIVNAQLSQ